MSTEQSSTIPYEKQADPQDGRMCGAASLSMVYRSFGQEITQAEVWPKTAKHNRRGSLSGAVHLMTQDALNRGFAALAIQAKHPLQVLRLCRDNGIRAILNHRLKEDGPTGHFTVLVDIDAERVVLHDPFFGPSRPVSHAELLELWRPRYLNAEIAGNVLIGIAAEAAALPPCQLCGTAIPASIDCPGCGKPVLLQSAALLGCMGAGCAGRLWNYLCCPCCGHTWSFSLDAELSATAPGSDETSVDLNPLFAELDKFFEFILSLGAAANRPEVQQQLEFLKASKEKLKLAQSEELINRRMHMAQLTQLQRKFQQEEEAIVKKQEEINQPAPPLDGNALGYALVKDLGLFGDGAPRAPGGQPQAAVKAARSPSDEEFRELLRRKGLLE